jgi:hypothetical protein
MPVLDHSLIKYKILVYILLFLFEVSFLIDDQAQGPIELINKKFARQSNTSDVYCILSKYQSTM